MQKKKTIKIAGHVIEINIKDKSPVEIQTSVRIFKPGEKTPIKGTVLFDDSFESAEVWAIQALSNYLQ